MRKKKHPSKEPEKIIMLTPRQFAEKHEVPYTTVMGWLRKGQLPEAEKKKVADTYYWEIPSTAPKPEPRMGRPPIQEKDEDV